MNRAHVLMMARVKNESRWIRRNLERTWQVCKTVVIFDDHSTDRTMAEALETVGTSHIEGHGQSFQDGFSLVYSSSAGERELHWLRSPFQETVDEVRDKNHLWDYVTRLSPRHVLCLDGDEMLSLSAIREFPSAIHQLEQGGASVIVMPFVYLWNDERQRRIDGVYRDIRHARLFTVDRAPDYHHARFVSHGPGGFHCGSIPERLNVQHLDMPSMPVIHWGYLDEPLRRRKLDFYNRLDPGNEGEGYYKHVVGEPNHLAPGPVQLVEYDDR